MKSKFVNYNKPVLWIDFHKTGGTTLKFLFLSLNNEFDHKNVRTNLKLLRHYTSLKNKEFDSPIHSVYHRASNRFIELDLNKINMLTGDEVDTFVTLYPDTWNNSFKFMIHRNPYTRFVSGYHQIKKFNKSKNLNLDIPEFKDMDKFDYNLITKDNIRRHIVDQPLYFKHINDIDFFISFENYSSDIRKLFNHLQLELNIDIPKLRSSNVNDYVSYYKDNNMAEFVYNKFLNDFKYFKYNKLFI